MSYEDLQKARTNRSAKEAEQEARQSKKAMKINDSGVRSRRRAAETDLMQEIQSQQHVDAQCPEGTSTQSCGGKMQQGGIVPAQWGVLWPKCGS